MTQDKGRSLRPLVARRRRFVVVVDDSPECRVALRFASARAAHVDGGSLLLFHVIPPAEFQHWMAVEDKMREESLEEAEELLGEVAGEVAEYCGLDPERVIRQGRPRDELQKFLESEADIFALFLGADTEGEPGPLVTYFSGPIVGSLSFPVVIVPGSLSAVDIDEMA